MKNIFIPNPKEIKEKIKQIINDGADNLHIVSDFDRTLTSYFINGKIANTSISQVREGRYLSDEYTKKAYALHKKYSPIEIDEKIPIFIRAKKMNEWWNNHLKLLVKYKMHKSIIENIINKGNIKSRKKSLKFYDILNEKKIPLIIFSAGKGEFIEGFLKKEKKLYKNIHIISNYYKFDKNDFVIGYKNKIIHVFNKNEIQIKNTTYYNQIKHRKNVILIGDGEGDVHMVDGLSHKIVLKIGFLNDNKDKLLNKYKEIYDIIILNDSDMGYVNKLIKKIN